jgi:hypothetical protein
MMEIGSIPSCGESGPAGGFWSVKSRHDLVAESLTTYSEMRCKMPISRAFAINVFFHFFQVLRIVDPQAVNGMRRLHGAVAPMRMDSRHAKG